MGQLQKKKHLNLNNVYTYLPNKECGACSLCALFPGSYAIALIMIHLAV